MKKLHPNAIIYFYLLGLLVLIFTLGFFVLVPLIPLFGLAVEGVISFFWSFLFLLVSMVIIFVIPLPWAQLAYKNYRYQLESKVVVIDKGVIWKKHVSIPYEYQGL
jgi:membrane protein YdbS with pleckstrin-like domain